MKALEEITDYKEAAQILAAEFAALDWRNGTQIHGGHIMIDGDGWKHYAFQLGFCPTGKTPVYFDWKSGVGNTVKARDGKTVLGPKKPYPAEVLGRVCADYMSAAQASFEDWADGFGYDQDSRKAFRVYEDCQALGLKLRALGLTSAQIERFGALANML
jgi:hypothetical protein